MDTKEELKKAEGKVRAARAKLARLKRANKAAERRRLDTRKFILGSALAAWWESGEAPKAAFLGFFHLWVRHGDPRLNVFQGTPWQVDHE
ncbi:MAG TPA: hypothetical protein VL974_07560 [Magnetospirillum sp.]|jgi:hypothetical protein|nr:hypothetical protein [Magnetospirillum sp.]